MHRAPLAAALASLLAAGCHSSASHASMAIDYLPALTDRGDDDAAPAPAISADGREVFFVHRELPVVPTSDWRLQLLAVRAADGVVRIVDELPMDAWVGSNLLGTPDGALYLVVQGQTPEGQPEDHLREATAARDVVIDAAVASGVLTANRAGDRLLVPTREGTAVVDPATGEAFATACDGQAPAAFSPAGDELACALAGQPPGPVVRVRLADGRVTGLYSPAAGQRLGALSWTEGRLLGAFGPDLEVVDLQTSAVLLRLDAARPVSFSPRAFTPDGRALVLVREDDWFSDCGGGWSSSCPRTPEGRVELLELAGGALRELASGPTLVGLGLSPDGRAVAYQYGREVGLRATGL